MQFWNPFRLRPFQATQPGFLKSSLCTQAQLESECFQNWAVRMGLGKLHLHRKIWEYCFITQALYERDLLRPGKQGLGFAVGQEPLVSLFASLGCQILATDLDTEKAQSGGLVDWVNSNQHAQELADLNQQGICPEAEFRERVSFRFVDMRAIPPDLGQFDFIWSSCALEHLGTLELGEKFIFDSLHHLKAGGIAVHTTEYNLSSNRQTVVAGANVIYRKRDIQGLAKQLRQAGHHVQLDFTHNTGWADREVDQLPYKQDIHLRLALEGFVATSFGWLIQKSSQIDKA
ncbi:MAG: hypothetical protein SFW36_02445 [Leptolyngbyaceae cyanobacterium bins.59]|nr:hypothetical protein [Leptolyngbyaceae cyanobacterium bins.59]